MEDIVLAFEVVLSFPSFLALVDRFSFMHCLFGCILETSTITLFTIV